MKNGLNFHKRRGNMSRIFVAAMALVISVGALGFAYSGQSKLDDSSLRVEISDAIESYELNDASSTTVYQQQVTNGWVTRDLLEVIAKQNAAMIENQAIAGKQQSTTNLLMGINALILALVGLSLALKSKKDEPAESTIEQAQLEEGAL